MKKILLVNGPNLNLLGTREPEIYGSDSLEDIEKKIVAAGSDQGMRIVPFQSNHEGGIIDFIHREYPDADGIIINPGALAHYSYALRDCLAATAKPVIEIHLSNIFGREEWRRNSVLSAVCKGMICGLGVEGYVAALSYFRE